MKNKTIAIIPARGGSKRLPGKNILPLGTIPLIAHSILFAQKNNAIIDEVYVSTDDDAIKKVALLYGAKVIHRPENLSGDFEPTVSALKHCLETIDDPSIENVILLQPTNPLRPENLITETFAVFCQEKRESLFTVSRNYHKFGKISDGKFYPYNYKIGERSQDLEPLYFENGLLYITKAKCILEDKIITEDAFPFLVDDAFAEIDIDTQRDLDYAEYLYQKHITNTI